MQDCLPIFICFCDSQEIQETIVSYAKLWIGLCQEARKTCPIWRLRKSTETSKRKLKKKKKSNCGEIRKVFYRSHQRRLGTSSHWLLAQVATGTYCRYPWTRPSPKSYIPYIGFSFSLSFCSTITGCPRPWSGGRSLFPFFLDQSEVKLLKPMKPPIWYSVPPVHIPTVF